MRPPCSRPFAWFRSHAWLHDHDALSPPNLALIRGPVLARLEADPSQQLTERAGAGWPLRAILSQTKFNQLLRAPRAAYPGTSGRSAGGSWVRCAVSAASGSSFSNTKRPVSSHQATQPKAYRSARWSISSPSACSGAMKVGVTEVATLAGEACGSVGTLPGHDRGGVTERRLGHGRRCLCLFAVLGEHESEIEDLDDVYLLRCATNEDVGGLDVAMDPTPASRALQPANCRPGSAIAPRARPAAGRICRSSFPDRCRRAAP